LKVQVTLLKISKSGYLALPNNIGKEMNYIDDKQYIEKCYMDGE